MKRIKPARTARARMTPMAMPALAPVVVPSLASATGVAVAEEIAGAVLETAAIAGMTDETRVVAWMSAADVGTDTTLDERMLV